MQAISLIDNSSDKEAIEVIGLAAHILLEDEAEAEAENSRQIVSCHRRYIRRDRGSAGDTLVRDYFANNSTYPPTYFRRRYRMRKELFIRIVEGISNYSVAHIPDHFKYFEQRSDCAGHLGFTILQKCTAAIRQLAYGSAADSFDEYLKMGERTISDCSENFCKCVMDLYSEQYLRKPTYDDFQRLYTKHEETHGFPGMLRSIDCMHWAWHKCPNAWKGQFTRGDHGYPTIMLEAVVSYDLCIWHAYFGVAGSNNDLNVLNQSPLFNDIINDNAPDAPFQVNQKTYKKGYYFADDIYPEWAMFVKSFSFPQEPKKKKFKKAQESARKDIERAFGVLQGRWAIIRNPTTKFSINRMSRIMYTCIILHNMIIEDAGFAICLEDDGVEIQSVNLGRSITERFNSQITNIGSYMIGVRIIIFEMISSSTFGNFRFTTNLDLICTRLS